MPKPRANWLSASSARSGVANRYPSALPTYVKNVAPKYRTSGKKRDAENVGVKHTVAPLASAGAHNAINAFPWNNGMQQ